MCNKHCSIFRSSIRPAPLQLLNVLLLGGPSWAGQYIPGIIGVYTRILQDVQRRGTKSAWCVHMDELCDELGSSSSSPRQRSSERSSLFRDESGPECARPCMCSASPIPCPAPMFDSSQVSIACLPLCNLVSVCGGFPRRLSRKSLSLNPYWAHEGFV